MDRFVPRLIGNVWYMVDTVDGHQTPCHSRWQAEERASFCSGVWRLVERRRAEEKIIRDRILAENHLPA